MIPIIVNGIQFGIVLTFLIGPVFFTIVQTSLERGFARGVLVVLGVSLSDILYVTICYFGIAQILASTNLKTYLAYGGGALLIGFGLFHLLVKTRLKDQQLAKPVDEKRLFRYVVKGFLINGMTPMVLFFWIATASLATLEFGYSAPGKFTLFFASLLGTVLVTDTTKAFLAARLQKLVTPEAMRIVNFVLGIVLIFFGCRLMLDASQLNFLQAP